MGLTHQQKSNGSEVSDLMLESSSTETSHLFGGSSKQKTLSKAVQIAQHVFDLHDAQQTVLQAGDNMYGTLETAIELRVSQLCQDLSHGHSDLPAAGTSSSTSTSESSMPPPTRASATAASSSTSGVHQKQALSNEAGSSGSSSSSGDPSQGRLGPKSVSIDARHASGQLAYGPGGLTIESLANFSSCRATACVYAGLWQYEVTVLTSGIQQLGWCTALCPFTGEEGVGDAADSYAFDGKRLRKWSVKCSPYGE